MYKLRKVIFVHSLSNIVLYDVFTTAVLIGCSSARLMSGLVTSFPSQQGVRHSFWPAIIISLLGKITNKKKNLLVCLFVSFIPNATKPVECLCGKACLFVDCATATATIGWLALQALLSKK